MTILVFGASSQIGYFLLPRLVARGESVVAVSRYTQGRTSNVLWRHGHLPEAVPTPPSVSAVISFAPLWALAEWLTHNRLAGAPRVVATSSMSAESKRDSSVLAERAIAEQLREGELALDRACARHGYPWTILRPTLVYGAGIDKSLTPMARRALRTRVFPLPAGKGLRQPVHADDIAQAVMAALTNPASAGKILSIGGGEQLPAAEMFDRVRKSLPKTILPLPVPRWLLRMGRHAMPQLRGPLERLDVDLIADNSELQRLLGIHPRPFQPAAAAWAQVHS